MSYHGDITLGSSLFFKFTTINAGVPTSISGAFVAAYPDNSTTEIFSGITLTPDFDGRVGLNHLGIVATSGNGYITGTNYDMIIASGTVAGRTMVGYLVGSFSIQARTATPASSQSSSGDPWLTNLPGSYPVGSAGYILASRMPTGTVLVGDKTGFSLVSPQSFDLIGNISGTLTNVLNVINAVTGTGGADPLLNNVPSTYLPGTAGYVLGTYLDDRISSRQPSGTFSSSISNADKNDIASRAWDSQYAPIRTLTTAAGDSIPPAAGDDVFLIRGDTFIWDISGLDLGNLSKIQFSVKKKVNDADSQSLIFVESGTGLLYIDGVPGTASNGSITYSQPSGTARIRVEAVETAKLDVDQSLPYDIQIIRTTGTLVSSPIQGNLFITWDSARATS